MLTASVELASIVDEAARRLRYALKAATDSGEDPASAAPEASATSCSSTRSARPAPPEPPSTRPPLSCAGLEPTGTTANNPLNEGRNP